MSRRARWADVFLHLLSYVLIAVILLFVAHQQGADRARQERQGQQIEYRLCTTLEALADLNPPPGNPATNPSRAYLQAQHQTLAQLGPDVGCPAKGTP